MIDIKRLYAKVLDKLNIHVVRATSAQTTVGGSATAWINVTPPSSQGVPVAMVGYYIDGYGSRMRVYCARFEQGVAQFAIANSTATSTSLKIHADFLMLGGGTS